MSRNSIARALGKKAIYIAGPMTGLEYRNFPEFDRAAAHWRAMGWLVLSPAEMSRSRGFDETNPLLETSEFAHGSRYLEATTVDDVRAVFNCDAIALLYNWQKSKGTLLEIAVAKLLNLDFYHAFPGPMPEKIDVEVLVKEVMLLVSVIMASLGELMMQRSGTQIATLRSK